MCIWTWRNIGVKRLRTRALDRGEWASVATKVEAILNRFVVLKKRRKKMLAWDYINVK